MKWQLAVVRLDMQSGRLAIAAEANFPQGLCNIAKFSPPILGGPECITTATLDHGIQFLTLDGSQVRADFTIIGHSEPVTDIVWNEEGNLLASADCSGGTELRIRKDWYW